MKSIAIAAGLLLAATAFSAAPAEAAGCLKGAVVGGVAGHYMQPSRALRRDGRLRDRPARGEQAGPSTDATDPDQQYEV